MSAAQHAHAGSVSASEQQAISQAIETGVALQKRGLLDDAERLYAGILRLFPKHFDALHLLGILHEQRGDSEKALEFIGAALELNNASVDAYSNHAQILLRARRFEEALVSVERALVLAPDHPEALISRATISIEQHRFREAFDDATRVIEKDPLNIDGWTKHGNVLAIIGERAQAVASFDRALALKPDHVEALNNRGCLLGDLDRSEEALAASNRVLELNPHHVGAWINRGHMLVEQHQEEEAIACYQRALAFSPHHPDALFNLGLNELRLGRFKTAWENYEHRWFTRDLAHTRRQYPLPGWTGEALDGPLLVSSEQGLGDQILYASMLAEVAARTPSVIFEAAPRLVPLFARSFPQIDVVAREESLYAGPAAAQIPLASLGRYFRLDWASFQFHENGYLRCDAELSARLRKRLADGRTVIGVSWSSRNPRFHAGKSAQLKDLESVLRLPHCRFIDLQYGDTQAEREAVQNDCGVTLEHLADIDNSNDIDSLAALISACDIVVSVSNTTAHLAGALGKETYVLVPSGRSRMWCWFRDRNDSPFYPRMRLKRKNPGQAWADLVEPIAAEIKARQGMQSW